MLTSKNIKLTALKTTGVSVNSATQVHTGFLAGWNSVSSTVRAALKAQLAVAAYSEYNIVAVGHGIGGAIASIGAIALRDSFVGR